MIIISVSEEIPIAQYSLFLYLGASFSAVLLFACLFHAKKGLKLSLFYTALCFASFYWWAYSKADEFYELSHNGDFLEASYVSPASDKLIPIANIASITYGVIGYRGVRDGCFISLNMNTGDRLRSAEIKAKKEFCKNIRSELMALLKSTG